LYWNGIYDKMKRLMAVKRPWIIETASIGNKWRMR